MTDRASSSLLALSEAERLQLLIGAVHDYAIYLLDPDGLVATWNPGAQRFKGYTAEEIIGRHFSTFYTPEDLAVGLPARALETAARAGRFEAEGWRVRKDGSRFWTHVLIDPVRNPQGELIGFAKVTRDVSEKKAADEALAAAEQRFRLLVQGVRDYAIYMLDPDGRVTNWNPGAQAIKGYTEDEIVGRHFSTFYTPDHREAGEPARALHTARTEGKYEREAQRVRKDGERFWANVVIDPIHNERGELIGFAKITRDITERRRAEEELERSRAALAQAQKMEAIGRLTGGVAHDFNNLLTVIRSSADFLRRPNLDEARRTRYVEAIAETAERAALLTSQLLAFARRQPLQPETFEVGARLRGLQHIMETTGGSAVSIVLEPQEAPLWVLADPSQFDTAVLNMVINARDAMPEGGAITLTAELAKGVPAVRGHLPAPGEFVAVSICDTGTGMTPETLQRIFEPFFTTKAVDKGTGLGLSQVYGFAKQSRGEVAVESEVGRGSTFSLYLPASEPRHELAAAPTQPAEPAELPHRRILLVEDNEGVGSFAQELLKELGQHVSWAGDARTALSLLETGSSDYDLVFTDVVMPGMNGIELARMIQQRWPDLPVVLTSGYSHVLAEEEHHGFPLLRKPYSIDGLTAVLHTSLST